MIVKCDSHSVSFLFLVLGSWIQVVLSMYLWVRVETEQKLLVFTTGSSSISKREEA